MAGELTDDGTFDTVIKCDICGEEERWTYDPGPGDDEPGYNEWVQSCIREFDLEHECQVENENEDDDNDVIDEETGFGQDTGDPDREDFGSDHGL